MTNAPLIRIIHNKPNASVRLLCFSYAGGSSATYGSWPNHLSSDVELAVVQLPGRGVRLLEQPYQTMIELVNAIFLAFEQLNPKPCIFYGHSMGARVAYELTLMLQRYQHRLPIHFIASGSAAPGIERTKAPIHHLQDGEFIKAIGALNGSSAQILANQEMMQLLLPALRADFKIIETYCNKNQFVLPTKVSVLSGDEDVLELADLNAWLTLFKTNTGIHWIAGDHFFVDKNKLAVLDILQDLIGEYLMVAAID